MGRFYGNLMGGDREMARPSENHTSHVRPPVAFFAAPAFLHQSDLHATKTRTQLDSTQKSLNDKITGPPPYLGKNLGLQIRKGIAEPRAQGEPKWMPNRFADLICRNWGTTKPRPEAVPPNLPQKGRVNYPRNRGFPRFPKYGTVKART